MGSGVSMAIPFLHFCVERDEGEWGRGCGRDNGFIQAEIGILPVWSRKVDVTMVVCTSPPTQARATSWGLLNIKLPAHY